MSVKEVRFVFDKQPGSLEIRLLEMQQNSVRMDMLPENAVTAAQAASDVFQKLIALDAAKFQSALLSLRGFTIALLTDPISGVTSLEILNVTDRFSIKINKLKIETAALFFKALPPVPKSTSAVVKPFTALGAPSLSKDNDDAAFFDVPPVDASLEASISPPTVAAEPEDDFFDVLSDDEPLALQSAISPIPLASSLPSKVIASVPPEVLIDDSVKPEAKTPLDQIKENFNKLFSSMEIQRGAVQKEPFTPIFLERFFGKIESCTFDPKTNDFSLVLAQEQKRKLLGPFSLHIRKQVKGRFNFAESKISFEHGCITLDWGWTSGYLLSLGKNPQNGQLTIGGKYLGITSDSDIAVENFVTMLEYNLPT